jgi:serine/threonine protein kinase
MLPFSLRQARQLRGDAPADGADGMPPAAPGNQSAAWPAPPPAPSSARWPVPSQPAWPGASNSPPGQGAALGGLPTWLMTPGAPDGAPASTQVSDGSFYPLGRATGTGTFAEQYAASGTTMSLPPLDLGTILKGGRYRLLQHFSAPPANTRLGQPEAPLWEASDADLAGTRVLIQELPLSLLAPERADGIQRQVMVRLELAAQAPGIPSVRDAFTERRRRFVVWALPEGERLSELVRARGAMPEVEVVRLGLRLVDLLERMEQMSPPLVHGNIAADNVLLRPDGAITLIGFSPALLVREAGAGDQGSAGGAKGYTAPEQLGGLADPRTDIFGVGAVLYFAATRFDPSRAENTGFAPARKVNGGVSRGLEAILMHALQPNVSQRFQTAADLRQQLSGLVAQEDLPASYASPATAPGAAGSQPGGAGQRYAPLTGAVGALRASLAGQIPPDLAAELDRQGKKARKRELQPTRQIKPGKIKPGKATRAARATRKRKRRPVLVLALILLVLAGLAVDGYFYATTQLHIKVSDYLPVFVQHWLAFGGK